MINKYLTFFILITFLVICSCSIIQSNHFDNNYKNVYTFLLYDWEASTTAGPLLVFQDQTGDFIFVLTENVVTLYRKSSFADSTEYDIGDVDIVTIELSALADNSNYVRLEENMEYYLELEKVKDVTYIKTSIPFNAKLTNNPELYRSKNFVISNPAYEVQIIKNGKINGEVFTCDQIYANYILKSALVVNDKCP